MSVSVQSKPLSAGSAANRSAANKSKAAINKPATGVPISDNRTADDNRMADKVCWIELQRYPYHPDHQVELLHLQAEADALIIKLQSAGRKNALEN